MPREDERKFMFDQLGRFSLISRICDAKESSDKTHFCCTGLAIKHVLYVNTIFSFARSFGKSHEQ